MSSWANRNAVTVKKQEPAIKTYFSSSEDYVTSSLLFFYSFAYCQRMAEPFYILDTEGYFQPLLNTSPILHFVKTVPDDAQNLAEDLYRLAPVLNQLSVSNLKRNLQSIFDYNGATFQRVDNYLSSMGLLRQTFDVGITLDISGCVPVILQELKAFQKRTGKQSLRVFVMTDSLPLLREFATKGDPTWSFVSLLRNGPPPTNDQQLLKTLGELRMIKKLDFVLTRFSSALGKVLYLWCEGQVTSYDKQAWKALN
jgi:hypothetical protein